MRFYGGRIRKRSTQSYLLPIHDFINRGKITQLIILPYSGLHTIRSPGRLLKAFNAPKLSEALAIDSRYKPRYVFAIGYPAETVVLEDMTGDEDADFKYYRTADGTHHVPKRPLSELIIKG